MAATTYPVGRGVIRPADRRPLLAAPPIRPADQADAQLAASAVLPVVAIRAADEAAE
jgi:hypothetical protein